jgi:PBSX family phage terminase large subunit
MKVKNHTYTDPSDNFLIVAPTYKIMTQSTLPPYLEIMRGVGDFNKADMTLKIHNGGTVYMRTGTDPDSIVGITNVRAVWGDEAGLYSLYFSENIAARAAFKAAQTLYTTSPYSLNWLFKDIIRPKMKNINTRPDVTLIQAASWENPYFPKDVIDRNRENMDPRRFNSMFGGKWEKMAGLVYDTFDEVDNSCEPFELPMGTRVVAGVDWGFTAPFALTVRAITPDGNHYQVSETYKTGLSISQRIDIAKQKKQIWGIKIFWCDPEEPAAIKEFNENGLPAAAADNDIRAGVDAHYELVKTKRYKVFRGSSPYTMDEYEAYHYPAEDDLGPDENLKEQKPVAQNNHSMDSNRYISIMERKTGLRTTPGARVPNEGDKKEDQFDRLERLKRKPRNNHSEKW